jgi:hypothetical protein
MAFFDNFNNPLYAPVQSGLKFFEGMNIFGAKPSEALTGILSPAEQEKLQNQALAQGVLGGLATYLSTPKNLGAGSPLPYLGKAYLGGMQQSQGAFDTALKSRMDSITMAKNMKELEMAGMTDVQKLLKAKNDLNPNSPTYKGDLTALDAAINKLTNVDSTFIRNYEYAVSKGYKGTPEDWQKLNVITQQQYLEPYRQQQSEYNYGPINTPAPKSVTMQDVADTAKATGKTTEQVIKDIKSKGITIRTK